MVQGTGNDPVQIWLRLKRSETSGRFSFHHPQEFLGYAGLHFPHGIEFLVREDDPEEVYTLTAQGIGSILSKTAYHAVVVPQSGKDFRNVLQTSLYLDDGEASSRTHAAEGEFPR